MPEFAHHHPLSSYALAPMYGEDRLGFVGFHDLAFVIARPVSAHAPWLAQRGQTLHEKVGGNYTNLTAGMRQALTLFQWTPPGVARRMWVLSDGEANRLHKGVAKRMLCNFGTNRWGDYNGIAIDPFVDFRAWIFSEYPFGTNTNCSQNEWRTAVGLIGW